MKRKPKTSKKDTDRERAIKRAIAVLGEGRVTFCSVCKNPKMPDILRTGNKESEKGFCQCGVDSLYREKYCIEIVRRFKNQKDECLNELTYYQIEPDEEREFFTPEGINHGGLKRVSPKQILAHFPTFEERSTENDILESTRQRWVDLFPQFSHSCEMCKQIQYYILIKGGLNNKFNSHIVKLLGANLF
ncbi:MAG: hypothetical protein LBG59_07810 [Candidatus Peribacteria bacterium]|nr:hypothetical protein [Candidatus Peribacteria bacterium]